MKYAIVLSAVAGLAAAQSLSDIPACAQPCIDAAVKSSTSCSASDYKCICDNENALVGGATSCVIQACGSDVATSQVLPATQKFCAAVEAGGKVSGTSTGASATVSSTATTGTTSTSVVTTTTSASNSTVTGGSNSTISKTSATFAPTGSGTLSAIPSTTTSTGGAALATGIVGSFAMFALGALAAL